jgi:hypothetical protein
MGGIFIFSSPADVTSATRRHQPSIDISLRRRHVEHTENPEVAVIEMRFSRAAPKSGEVQVEEFFAGSRSSAPRRTCVVAPLSF